MKITLAAVCAAVILLMVGFSGESARAEETDCNVCHPDIANKKDVHPAVAMGCTGCHSGLNVADIPHKVTGKFPKGLSSSQPELCYGCHDSKIFTKKNVHAALQMGCTTCHNPHSTDTPKLLIANLPDLCFNCHDKASVMGAKVVHAPVASGMCTGCHSPHSSDNAKLLLAEAPELCFKCHDKGIFSKKFTHVPVAGGMCLSCHSHHTSSEMALLQKKPAMVCLECHQSVLKGPHASTEKAHPLGVVEDEKAKVKNPRKKAPKKEKGIIMDPMRPGKELYCGSCHNPHGSDSIFFFRYKANSKFELCVNCHQK